MAGRVLREAQLARSVVDAKFAVLEEKALRDRRLQSIEAGQGDHRIEVLLSKALVSPTAASIDYTIYSSSLKLPVSILKL